MRDMGSHSSKPVTCVSVGSKALITESGFVNPPQRLDLTRTSVIRVLDYLDGGRVIYKASFIESPFIDSR